MKIWDDVLVVRDGKVISAVALEVTGGRATKVLIPRSSGGAGEIVTVGPGCEVRSARSLPALIALAVPVILVLNVVLAVVTCN